MSRVLRRADGPNLSSSCVSIAFLFLITRTSVDQSTFMGYPSVGLGVRLTETDRFGSSVYDTNSVLYK